MGKKVPLSEWHVRDSKSEGGASCSGSLEDSCIHNGSPEINGESLKTPSLLNRGKKFHSEIEDTCTYNLQKT